MARPNLVIARVGSNSLHASWTSGGHAPNWDLYLCPYQKPHEAATIGCIVGDVIPGPKWTGLQTLLNNWEGWRAYERIWLPDDDLFVSQQSLNRMFELAAALEFDLCAPALHENSYYAHFSTMRNHACVARRTGFVEIMAPCFTADVLDRLLPTLDRSPTGWGWGLDSLWPKLLGYRNVGVIDAAPVLHTRPVGLFRDAELDRRVRAESDAIMQEYRCSQVHTTFSAIGANLKPLELSPEALAATLAEGWRYLWTAQPAVLPWLMEAQRPKRGWGRYPIAGAPACAMQ